MKATDLRIGNLVYYAGIVCKVLGYHHDDYLHTDGVTAPVASFQPIELTEEWLLKIGYKPYNNSQDGRTLTFDFPGKLDIDFYEGKIQLKSHYEGYHLYRALNIKYVHQLQNLYFALCGEELTIK